MAGMGRSTEFAKSAICASLIFGLTAAYSNFGLFEAIRRELLEGPLRRSTRWRRANTRRVPPSSSLHLPAVVPELSERPYAPLFQLKLEKG